MALYTAASLLHALAERVNSEEQREQRKHPAGETDEVVVFHRITLFRNGKQGSHRASPLDYMDSISYLGRACKKKARKECKRPLTFFRARVILWM